MIVWFDFETRGVDLRAAGTYRYAATADPILLAFAIDNGPVEVVEKAGRALTFADLPEVLQAAAVDPTAIFWAWNCGFDRTIWNYSLAGSPFLAPERVRDAMAVAAASNLPRDLERASRALGGGGKQDDGKLLIGKFSDGVLGELEARENPEDWRRFVSYAAQDILAMRDAVRKLRPLPDNEWAVYVANERISDYGIGVDLAFCDAADWLSFDEMAHINGRLWHITDGEIETISQNVVIANWVYHRLEHVPKPTEAREAMITVLREPDASEGSEDEGTEIVEKLALPEDEEEQELPGLTIARGVVERLSDYLRRINYDEDPVLREVLEIREFGASAAFKKFAAILKQQVNGRLHGQIVFNGAAMTGRFSGKGVQPQNLTRKILGTDDGDDYGTYEAPTIDLINDGCSREELARFGNGEVPARKLSLLVRPAIVAPEGSTLLKADYAQIEARMLPWLSANPTAFPLLEAFHRMDVDPDAPDLYRVTASNMLGKPISEISKEERQVGKVSVLACGYQGAKGALMSMAASYRLYLSETEAAGIVSQWRAANPWAPLFWGAHGQHGSYGLIGAAMQAINEPGTTHRAGRIVFRFSRSYLGGTLFMRLPSGRLLTYPWCRWRKYQPKDKKTKKLLEPREGLTFRRPEGISALYGGRLAENATQAAAADLLREALVVLDQEYRGLLRPIMHAHDEITCEVDVDRIDEGRAALVDAMTYARPWAQGLPLGVEVTERWYYSAAKVRTA